jgi:hypothetical protein
MAPVSAGAGCCCWLASLHRAAERSAQSYCLIEL